MSKSTTERFIRTLAFTACVGLAGFATASEAHEGKAAPSRLTDAQREVIREATSKFRDPLVAEAAGYVNTGACVELPGVGGMGVHFVKPPLLTTGIDPTLPEILVYEPTSKGLRLVAVEYFSVDADQDLATDSDRPTLFGRAFEGPSPGHDPSMPVHYDLHAWVFKSNPMGDLAAWNPNVSCG